MTVTLRGAGRHTLSRFLVVAAAAAVTACGGDDGSARTEAPLGSPRNPIVAQLPADRSDPDRGRQRPPTNGKPGFRELVDRQSERPATRRSPCELVTKAQAQSILGTRILDPFEAPQGPTCIYRDRTGKIFVSLSVEKRDIDALRKEVKRSVRIEVGGRTGYCASYGRPMLFRELPRGRVLTVSGQCGVAKRFASRAVSQLKG